jgi:hypothetical protein
MIRNEVRSTNFALVGVLYSRRELLSRSAWDHHRARQGIGRSRGQFCLPGTPLGRLKTVVAEPLLTNHQEEQRYRMRWLGRSAGH